MSASAVSREGYQHSWRAHLDGKGDNGDSWEAVRRLRGGLYDVVEAEVRAMGDVRSAVDLAIGTGAFGLNLFGAGVQTLRGYDFNNGFLEDCWASFERRYPNHEQQGLHLELGLLDIGTKWRLPGVKVRLVTCSAAAMTLSDAQLGNLLESVRGILAPGGRFIINWITWNQGFGTWSRKRDRYRLIFGKDPNPESPRPFGFQRRDPESHPWPEFFRPDPWWPLKFAETGWQVETFHPLQIPDDVTDMRPDKFGPRMRTYDVYVLKR